MLHSNTIHSIEDRAFNDLKSLQVLKMSYNKVKEIQKDTFKGLSSLLRLHIDHNYIEFISPEAFYGLTKLQLVNLEGNFLQQLHPDTFITLRHSQVFKLSSVRNIHLSDNLLTTLPADIFSGCSQLENVFLHGNPWTCDCRMKWLPVWAQRNAGVLKCKRDKGYSRGLCPVCESPAPSHNQQIELLPSDAFTCVKPWVKPHLKQRNITLDEGDFTPVSPKDFIAPLGSIQMNVTDQFHSDASLSCTVQRPSAFENLTQSLEEEAGHNVTVLTTTITTYLVCNVDYEQIQRLWQILAAYSDSPMRLERGLMLARSPDMVFRYSQMKTSEGEEGIHTNIEAEIKASPGWLMQGEVSFQLDRTTTTFSTLHIKYQSVVNLRVETTPPKKDHYSWTMIKRDNQTKTEHTVLTGGVAQLTCQIQGEPKPMLEWILPDGSKVRAPFSSDDRRIIITAEGKLTLRGADTSDTGLYRCIATNYLDADILVFRVTVLSPDVEEADINGVQLSRPLGENLVLDCSSSGNPEGSVQWILPDHSVIYKSQGTRKLHKNGTILIQGLTARDRGFYRCLVANQLGVDLLVSQVTITGKRPKIVPVLDSEGSAMDPKEDLSLTEMTVPLSEIPSSSPYDRTSQESRTITSDRPYPRFRSPTRGGSRARLEKNRRRPVGNRRIWSSRVFNKASRKVDPQKFAELMKRAQDGSKISTKKEVGNYKESNGILSGDGEFGSGEDDNEDNIIVVPQILTSTIENPHDRIFGQGRTHTAENHIDFSTNTYQHITESYRYMQSDFTPVESSFTHNPSFIDTTELYALGRTTAPHSDVHSVMLHLTVTDTSQETQLQFSGEHPADLETSTGPALSFTTDPNITPLREKQDPVELTHNDPDSHSTFTAVTTTERRQDEITFHTTQTIKSPNLPAGSTIISRQQIHIIPKKNARGWGRRRNFHSHRRIIKPNKITDIQSFINKLKQPSVKKEWSDSVSHQTEQTTDKKKTASTNVQVATPAFSSSSFDRTERPASTNDYISSNVPFTHTEPKPEASTGYITSADVPEFDPTYNPVWSTHKRPSVSTTATTTTASTVIRGRIPWDRLFGGREKEKILGRLRRPFINVKKSTTAETTTAAQTTAPVTMPPITAHSLVGPQILSPSRHKESSIDDDYGDLSSADFELTTTKTHILHVTTTSPSYYFGLSTTGKLPPESETLPFPPTVKPPLVESPGGPFESGSGGLPDNRAVVRKTPERTKGRQGRRRWPFKGRRPIKLPGITGVRPTTTTEATTMLSTSEATTLSLLLKPLYTPPRKEDRTLIAVSSDKTSKEETGFYGEMYWGTSLNSLPSHSTTKIPLVTSTAFVPATTIMPKTTKGSRVHSTITLPTQNGYTTHRPPMGRVRPTLQNSVTKGDAERGQTFDTMTAFENVINNKATGASVVDFDTTTQVLENKPKIVGGNAASFTVLSDSDAFLPCEAKGNPKPVIIWKRFSTTGGTITIAGRMGKFEVLNNGTLLIENTNIKDRGQYLCLAENNHGSDKLLVTLSVVAYPSRILEPKMHDIKSHVGDTVKMNCKAEGRPTPFISWILANRTQVRGQNTERGRVSVSAEGTLIIEHVSVYDRGHYKCIASNSAGVDTATVRLQVVTAPPGIMEEKRQQLKATVSQNLWLPCTGQGSPKPTIHWVLSDGSVVRSGRPASDARISIYDNGTLHFKDVTPGDSGKYECIATSSTGSERRVVTLTVKTDESAPQILETSSHMTELSFGDQLRLNCSAIGNPKPSIIWRLPSKAVVDKWHRMGNRIHVLDNGTLIVNNINDKDSGVYICVARSKISDDVQLMKVSVSMKPAKIEPKAYGRKQVPIGNDLKVDCKASGAPKPEISWGLPDGTVVNSALQSDASSGGGRARRYTLFDNGTLYVNQVGMSEEGDYTCYAENQVGKDEMHVHISVVTVAPRIRPPSQIYATLKPGASVRFDCEALGEPKPKIFWILPTNDVIAASSDRYLMHVNGSLDIRNVKLIDAGEYVCVARNPAGENKIVYKLNVHGISPIINGYHQNRTVIKDVAVKHSRKLIDCKAEGHPAPSITWIMPDNIFLTAPYTGSRIIVHHNGTLEIRNVRPTDTAEFICIARNDGGDAAMVVQLEVTSRLQRPIFKNPFNERILFRIGKTTVLNCSADGYPMPEITFTLPNGTRFTRGQDHGSRHHLGIDGTLVIYSPHKEDAGKYRCGAKNLMGYIEKLIILDVGQKPYILTRPRGIIRSVFGEPLFLHCLSDGSPRPKIYWTLPGGHTLTRPQVLGRYQFLENGTLVVQDASLHDRGNYICRARNDAGEAMVTVPVIIIGYPPRITTAPPTSVSAVTGTPIQLNCAATGIPRPEILWELPDHSVLSSADQGRPSGSELLYPQGTLIIQRPTTSDSGTYKCMAKNHLGTHSRVSFVHVK
ncbi:immunoglobulin superfamily member 10 isoform X2 [Betta splendens]|nr:immunoglobulin superfamily member 10 isoform X2 [Betta splendens]